MEGFQSERDESEMHFRKISGDQCGERSGSRQLVQATEKAQIRARATGMNREGQRVKGKKNSL